MFLIALIVKVALKLPPWRSHGYGTPILTQFEAYFNTTVKYSQ